MSIRDATDNARSLDDVTRALYARFAARGRGFSTADLLALLRETGMPDVDGFYRRYVDGREPLPYETVLPKAGFAVERRTLAVTNAPYDFSNQLRRYEAKATYAVRTGHRIEGAYTRSTEAQTNATFNPTADTLADFVPRSRLCRASIEFR